MEPSTPFSKKFSGRLQAARELRRMSQAQLAEKAGFQPSAISHFESDRRAPSFANLKRLADALDVTTDYLLGRTDDPQASGPTADRLFRDAQHMTKEDLETLADIANAMAKKNKARGKST